MVAVEKYPACVKTKACVFLESSVVSKFSAVNLELDRKKKYDILKESVDVRVARLTRRTESEGCWELRGRQAGKWVTERTVKGFPEYSVT